MLQKKQRSGLIKIIPNRNRLPKRVHRFSLSFLVVLPRSKAHIQTVHNDVVFSTALLFMTPINCVQNVRAFISIRRKQEYDSLQSVINKSFNIDTVKL